jgi:DNA invertase Pin-like site-specific DNA recombinase
MALPHDIYTRASPASEGSSTHEQQEREARDFARSQGLTVGRVLIDRTKSTSATLDRPVLQEALRRVEAGESAGVIVAYLSRASRDTIQGLELLDRITRAGGTVYAPNLPDYTTADGRMLTTIQLAIDAGYRDRKGEELEKRKRESIEAGIPVHTRAPVGLHKRRDKRLEHHPRTGPIVLEVFERRARGEGPAALAAFLESRGVKTSQGSRTWSKQAVYGLIENPTYKGVLRYGKDDRYTNPDGVVGGPLVDPATWQAAQHPNGHQPHAAKSDESRWLVTGVLRCHACRYAMQGTTTSRGKPIYRCTRRDCPDRARIDADTIEAAAVEAFWKLTADLEAVGVPDASGELEALQAQLDRAEQRLAQVEGPAAQDAFGDRYIAVVGERREARDRAREALGHGRAAASTDGIPSSDTLRAAWERMGIQDRRELLHLRFHALDLSRDRALVVWPAGSDVDLPRRGYGGAAGLAPFPKVPRRARSLTL